MILEIIEDSYKILTFSQEWLLGNPKDFGPWDFFMEPGSSLSSCKITISHLVLSDTCPNELDDVHFESMSQTEIDKFYNNANISHKITLIPGGLSASIYLYDIFGAIAQGAKNTKFSKSLRMKLKQGPVEIQNKSLQW